MKTKVLTIIFFLLISIYGNAQSDTVSTKNNPRLEVKVADGNRIIGTLEKEDEKSLWLKTDDYGVVQIDKSKIKSRNKLDETRIKNGTYWFENPNATRNLYGPTGYGLKKGEGYYQNFYILLNSVSYGFSDNFTMGFGIVPLFGTGATSFTLTPKVSFPIVENMVNAGAGILYIHLAGENLGVGYGVLTLGSKDNNITFGGGYGMMNGEFSDGLGIMTISGNVRVAKRLSLVTENWFLLDKNNNEFDLDNAFYSYSVRYMMDRLSFDLGFVNMKGSGVPIGIPLVGLVIPFEAK